MNKDQLQSAQCEPCQGGISPMDAATINEYLRSIHAEWQYVADRAEITRSFKFKNFGKTMFFVNALAHMADQQGHHPDVSFGYNYCRVSFTTHEAKGLTINDFICAKKVDNLVNF